MAASGPAACGRVSIRIELLAPGGRSPRSHTIAPAVPAAGPVHQPAGDEPTKSSVAGTGSDTRTACAVSGPWLVTRRAVGEHAAGDDGIGRRRGDDRQVGGGRLDDLDERSRSSPGRGCPTSGR